MPKSDAPEGAAKAAINLARILEGLEQQSQRVYSLASLCYTRAASGDDLPLENSLDQLTDEAGDQRLLNELREAIAAKAAAPSAAPAAHEPGANDTNLTEKARLNAIFHAAQESSALAEAVRKCLDSRTSPCNEDHDNGLIALTLARRIESLANAAAALATDSPNSSSVDDALATIEGDDHA